MPSVGHVKRATILDSAFVKITSPNIQKIKIVIDMERMERVWFDNVRLRLVASLQPCL